MIGYFQHWRELRRPAKLYLVHVILLTLSSSAVELFFNLGILALGYSRSDLGRLNLVAIWASVVLSLPLWWLVTRIGLRVSLLLNAMFQALAVAMYALAPSLAVLFAAAGIAGASSVLFQVSAAPLMMRYSDATTRDYLFSASAGLTIAVAGLGSLLVGGLPSFFGRLLGVGAESGPAYQAAFVLAAVGIALSALPLINMPSDKSYQPNDTPVEAQQQVSLKQQMAWLWFHRALVLALMIPPALISIGAALLLPYLNLFFKQQFGVSDPVLGLIFALLNVATGAAVLVGPAISTRLGKAWTVALAQALSIPFLLLMGFVPLVGVAVAAAMARGALFNLGRPLYDAFAMERIEQRMRPTVIGMMGGAATIGYLFAPELSVRVQEQYGFGPLFLATALCYTLATVVIVLLFATPTRRTEAVLQYDGRQKAES